MKYLIITFIGLSIVSCGNKASDELSSEINSMYKTYNSIINAEQPSGEYKQLNSQEWIALKEDTAKKLKNEMNLMIEKYGIIGLDNTNEDEYYQFWEIYQRFNYDTEVQNKHIELMKNKVDTDDFDAKTYAFILDRFYLNQNQPQVYGTQVDFDRDAQKAFPINLKEPAKVNLRREKIGLEPLENYIAEMKKIYIGN